MAGNDKNQPQEEIKTVEQLNKMYPDLVKQIKDETIDYVNGRTVEQAAKVVPDLSSRIVESIKPKDIFSNVKGFKLNVKDPFAAGALRVYASIKKLDGLELPYVLDYNDKASREAIASYILRAEGGGRHDLANAAKEELKKCK